MSSPSLGRIDRLRDAGDDAGALAMAERLVADGSREPSVHFRLASMLLRAGRYADADAATLRAAQLAPRTPADLVEMGKRLAYFNRAGALRQFAQARLRLPMLHPGAEADLAALLSMLGEQDAAWALMSRASRHGEDPVLLYNRSQLHLYAGRLDASEADLRKALVLEPTMAKAHWALSKLPGPRRDAADLRVLTRLADATPSDVPDAPYLRYALFNRLDALDDVERAWVALEGACRSKRAQLDYDPARSRALFDALLRLPPVAAPAGAGVAHPAALPRADAPLPVFIVGMHRSGTTLLERMLGNHPKVRGAGELYDFPAALRLALGRHFPGPTDIEAAMRLDAIDFAALGRDYLRRVAWRAEGRAVLVDKLPTNILNAGYIARALPEARVLHIHRAPMDTCFSSLKELFSNAAPYSYDQAELADWYRGVQALGVHWQQAAPGQVLDVDYEALARAPREEGARVLAFCGLAWDDACLDVGNSARTVNTASSAQVREPIHTRGIGAWQRYAQYLGPLQARLAGL